jgi:hypothetical protein
MVLMLASKKYIDFIIIYNDQINNRQNIYNLSIKFNSSLCNVNY